MSSLIDWWFSGPDLLDNMFLGFVAIWPLFMFGFVVPLTFGYLWLDRRLRDRKLRKAREADRAQYQVKDTL